VTTVVVLVQHADKERIAGDPDLTALGVDQAHAVAALLSQRTWDLLVTSPLRRARHTAEIIGAACGLQPRVELALRERMNWGDALMPQSIDEFVADWQHATFDPSWTPPSGTSSHATGARMHALLDELVQAREVERSLAVTHGGATLDLLRQITTDIDLDRVAPNILDNGVESCGLTTLQHDGARWNVLGVGQPSL
jgi:broad specificity phosphatase PhoE